MSPIVLRWELLACQENRRNKSEENLGRPFLATSKAIIDMNLGEITLRSGGKSTTVKTFNAGKYKCFMLEWKDRDATPLTTVWQVYQCVSSSNNSHSTE
ncbi:hypothetical protein QL285_020566 [Trifolium repens]|nr:hypothetical protein QL285_020566 [Trifolium repens]